METFEAELRRNAREFLRDTQRQLGGCFKANATDPRAFSAYCAATSLQAWRVIVYEQAAPSVQTMLLEAQNDALLSVVLAQFAMWRPALQSLRSMLEGVLRVVYFSDHPVELAWWDEQNFKMPIRETIETYLPKHPSIQTATAKAAAPGLTGGLLEEYRALSHAVHGSGPSFLMTKPGRIQVSAPTPADYGQWLTRHGRTLGWLNVLLAIVNAEKLTGTQNMELRRVVALALTKGQIAGLKKLGITLKREFETPKAS